MPKFLTFHSPLQKELKENPLKALWESFQSLDQFTKGFLVVILLLLLATPFIVNNLQIFKPHAQQPQEPTLGEQAPESVPDEILVKFKAGVADRAKEKVRNEHGLSKIDEIKQIGVERVKVNPQSKDALIQALSHNPQVKYAEANYINHAAFSPNDTYFSLQWNLISKLNTPQAWDISTGSASVVIAVLDTGIDVNHEDLIGRYIGSPAADDNGHGTEVASVAVANTNNGKGIAGVCWQCMILSYKVLNSGGSGSDSTLAVGITTAADNGAKVINMSLGSYTNSLSVSNAVTYAWNKGIVLVAGAGNDNTSSPFYPASLPNVLGTGATNDSDGKSSISNTGPNVKVVAPGEGIISAMMGGSYDLASGTSLASPHVAGLAGLIFSANPSLTNQQVVGIITSTALDLGDPGWDQYYGYGRINACKALKAAVPTSSVTCPTTTSSPTPAPSSSPSPTPSPTPIPTPTPDTTAPTVTITSPTSGSTVSGSSVSFNVDATDNVGVTKVEFYADNVLLPNGTEVSAPYTASWDSTTYSNSSHSLTAKAYDNAGNVGSSSSINVNVSNIASPIPSPIPTSTPAPSAGGSSDTISPVISITSPLNGSILPTKGSVKIQANASDSSGISQILMYFDNTLIATCNGVTSCQGSKSVTQISKGTHTIRVQASDNSIKKNTSTTTISVVK